MSKQRYQYTTNCTEMQGDDVDALIRLKETATEITYAEFMANVDNRQVRELFPNYDWRAQPQHLTLAKDYAVHFHRGSFKRRRCYYIDHSRIEYLFVLPDKE